MKKIIQIESIVCDCCEKPLDSINYITNCKNEDNYLKKGNIELCFLCLGKLVNLNFKDNITEDTLKTWIESYKGIKQSIEVKSDFTQVNKTKYPCKINPSIDIFTMLKSSTDLD